MVASAIDHKLALTLAIETINGMAKTAPMTERAMQQAQQTKQRQYQHPTMSIHSRTFREVNV